jgi:DME family drug/metabolite transporter
LTETCVKRMIGELAALGAAISWTFSAILYRKALQQTKPISANIIRLSCTSAILLVFLIAIGKLGVLTNLSVNVAVLAAVSGAVGLGLGDTLYMLSLKLVGVARTVPITCTYPLFGLLWTIVFSGETITLGVGLGTVAIVAGVWLLSYEKEEGSATVKRQILVKGVAAALATALLWSVSISMMDLAVEETPSLDQALIVNVVRASAIGLLLLVFSPIIDRDHGFLKVSRKTVATLIAGGLVALGLGWFFLTFSFTETMASRAIPISSTTPLFSAFAGVVLLHEKISVRSLVGSVVVVAGVFLIFLL